jgi:tetratricopeptide (TPR) repeat protein
MDRAIEMRKMNIILTAAVVILCAGVVWLGATAIVRIWRPSVEIGEIVDDKDGSNGRRAQAIVDFILREAPEIQRKADLSAISVVQGLEVPMVSRPDPGLQRIERLDIKVKDVHLNWAIAFFRALAKPSCEVSGRLLVGTNSTEMVLELTDSSVRSTPIVVSVPRTADESNDIERAATEAAYQLLYDIYRHFAKDKSRVPGTWISLERFTEGLRSLQEYRLAARYGDAGDGKIAQAHLSTAIEELEQVKQIDPSYNDGLFYLGVAYFEQRGLEDKAKEVFEELQRREPSPLQTLEARFYLGYAWFRTYEETGLEKALDQYSRLQADLESRSRDKLPHDERKRALGLLAETYSQMASAHANSLYLLRGPDCDPSRSASARESARLHFQATRDYALKAQHLTEHSDEISPEIKEDVEWRQLNALGYAEFSFACFDNENEYRKHCDQAFEYYNQALQRSPLNFNILENLGEVYRDHLYSGQDLEQAKKLFLRSAGLKPKDVYASQQLGMVYEALWRKSRKADDKDKMVKYYQEAAQRGSKYADLRLKKLRVLVKGKDE